MFRCRQPDKDNIDRLQHEQRVAIRNVAAAYPCTVGSLCHDPGLKPLTEELIDILNRVQQAIGAVALSMTSRFSMRLVRLATERSARTLNVHRIMGTGLLRSE